jgi:MurNAc alpha-1-phosphate uridylyltransferase
MPASPSSVPNTFSTTPPGAFSLDLLFDRAIEAGRLYGPRPEGVWMHVSTPEATAAAESAILASVS